jgi:hypothetical protein
MKHILLTLLSIGLIPAFAQSPTKISFSLKGDQPVSTSKLTGITLPLEISFAASFAGKTIALIAGEPAKTIALKGIVFGDPRFTLTGDVFILSIDRNGVIDPVMDGDQKLTANTFQLKIGAANPIAFSLKSQAPPVPEPDPLSDYQPGYIYDDAIELAGSKDVEQIKNLLAAYGSTVDNIDQNPFLKEYFEEQVKASVVQGGGLNLLTQASNLDVTNLAAGVARFLAERTKEELNEAFFERMTKQLNANPELTKLFPQTSSILKRIESYSYTAIMEVLKEAFETDIRNLPSNLYALQDLTPVDCKATYLSTTPLHNCEARLAKLQTFWNSREGHWTSVGLFTVKEAASAPNPAELLKQIATSETLQQLKIFAKGQADKVDFNVASAIELNNFISVSLLSRNPHQIWISSRELALLIDNPKALKIYLGLLLAKEQSATVQIDFYTQKQTLLSFGDILRKAYDDYNTYETAFRTMLKNAHTAFNSANMATQKLLIATEKSIPADAESLYQYYRTLTSSIHPIAHNTLLKDIIGRTDIADRYDQIEVYLNASVDLVYHISTQKYSAAIYDATQLLGALDTVSLPVERSFLGLKRDSVDEAVFKQVTHLLTKYGMVISTVANAQSSDEVKQALEASTLPAGSYSVKRKTNWSMCLNAYVGPYWNYANTDLPAYGLAAPIVFNLSKGFSKTGNLGGLSLNLQVFDLGALVNYYLIKGDTATLPNTFSVKLSNVFAPGFNLCYNVPNTPLSIAWGGQYIPTLYTYRQINGNRELTASTAFRFQVSLLVDIPLYNMKVWGFR